MGGSDPQDPLQRARRMKFGKDLEQYKVAGWEDKYIDYNALKSILKRLGQEDADVEDVDADFFMALEEELEKVVQPSVARADEQSSHAMFHAHRSSPRKP